MIFNPLTILLGLLLLAFSVFLAVAAASGKVRLAGSGVVRVRGLFRNTQRSAQPLSPARAKAYGFAIAALFALVGAGMIGNEVAVATSARTLSATCAVTSVYHHYTSSSRHSSGSSWYEISTSCSPALRSNTYPQVRIGQTYKFSYYTSRNLFGVQNAPHLLAQPVPAA